MNLQCFQSDKDLHEQQDCPSWRALFYIWGFPDTATIATLWCGYEAMGFIPFGWLGFDIHCNNFFLKDSTFIWGICSYITKMTALKFLPGFNIKAVGVFQGGVAYCTYISRFLWVRFISFLGHFHQYCKAQPGRAQAPVNVCLWLLRGACLPHGSVPGRARAPL